MPTEQPHFTIAGIPIRIEWSFWLIAVFLGFGAREGWLLLAWVAIVLVSVLVHELGHAFALRAYQQQPRVVLHAFGGLTYGSAAHRSKSESIIVSAAGPLTAFALLGVPAYVYLQSFDLFDQFTQHDRYVIVHDIAWVNIVWSIVNLLPILPLDGGNIAQSLVGPQNARLISMVTAGSAALYFFSTENQFGGIFLLLFAFTNFQAYQQQKGGGVRPAVHDKFDVGAQEIAEGRVDEGLQTMSKAYLTRASGPSNLGPVQQVAQSGLSTTLASMLLMPGGAGPNAAATLQAHLHYAGCFRESADVGALVHSDGRADRGVVAFDVACSLARAGHGNEAMAWVRQAITDGFTAGALLDGDPDLATLRVRPDWTEVRALAG